MRKTTLGVALAATAILGATWAVPAFAGENGRTIRYLSTNPTNTDLDLGARGFSVGNMQVFTNDAVRNGEKIGYEAGECQIVLLTDTRLVAHCVQTLVLADGELTAQGVFQENLAEGPKGVRWAITGGTGRYRGATGEAVGEFVPDTDDANVTIRLN